MNITVTFNNLDEVKDFAAMFGSQTSETKTTEPVIPQDITQPPVMAQPAAPAVPVTPVSQPSITPVVPTAPVSTQDQTVPTAPAQNVPVAPVQTAPVVLTSSRTYTPDELAKAAMQLMDSGKQNELLTLLHQFGTNSIPTLQPDQYGAFATALRGMGAQI